MCGSNPELSPEVNSAKCIGGTALGFAIVTLVGFAIVPWGLVSALAGLFGVIAGSIVCCCGPKAKGEGDGKMNAAGILFIIAAVFHFIAIILPVVGFVILTAAATATSSKRAARAASRRASKPCLAHGPAGERFSPRAHTLHPFSLFEGAATKINSM